MSQQSSFGPDYITREEEQKRRTTYLAKIGVLIILTLGSAFVLGQYVSYSFYQNIFSIPDIAIPLGITLVVFLTFFFFSILFIRRKDLLALIAGGSCAAIVVSFINLFDIPLLIGTLLCLALFFFTVYETKAEIGSRIKIRFIYLLNGVTAKVIFAITILLASLFYGAFITKPLDENNFLMPRSVFKKTIPLTQNILNGAIGSVDFDKSLTQMAEDRVNEVSAGIPAGSKKQLVETTAAGLEESFKSILKIDISRTKPLSDALYDGFLEKFNTADQTTKSWILIVFMIIFVFSIQALTIVVRIVLIPVAFLLYELLLRIKFAHIVYENASKEIVTL